MKKKYAIGDRVTKRLFQSGRITTNGELTHLWPETVKIGTVTKIEKPFKGRTKYFVTPDPPGYGEWEFGFEQMIPAGGDNGGG